MKRLKTLGGTALLGAMAAGTAQADVTADQVWQSWKDFSASMGQTLTVGSEERLGGVLTVSDVAISTVTEQGGSITGALSEIVFEEQADGTVAVTLPPEYPMILTTPSAGGTSSELNISLRQTALSLAVSGDATEMTYDVSGPQISLVIDSATGQNGAAAPEDVNMELAFNDVTGSSMMSESFGQRIVSAFEAGTVTLNLNAEKAGGEDKFTATTRMADVQSNSSVNLPEGADLEQMSAALQAGFASDGSFTHGAADYSVDFQDGAAKGSLTGSAASGTLAFGFNKDSLSYTVDTMGTDVTARGMNLPVPQVNASIAELAFSLMMPVAQSAMAQDFTFVNRIVGLTLGDDVWALFDPTAVLPRVPATVILDLAGKGNWLVDIFAIRPDAAPEQAPGEITALTVRQAQVSVAGADLQATGDATFDNAQPGPDGMPKVTGVLNATLVGGNALLDRLVQLGFLPNDQAMGARMMLGLFARPGAGTDTLTSQVEFKPDGTIFANGQQIQ